MLHPPQKKQFVLIIFRSWQRAFKGNNNLFVVKKDSKKSSWKKKLKLPLSGKTKKDFYFGMT